MSDMNVAETTPPAPRRRSRTALIVTLVVGLIAVAGLGGWLVVRPWLAPPGTTTSPESSPPAATATPTRTATPTPEQHHPATPLTVPYEPAAGLPGQPNQVRTEGVWSDVAVVRVNQITAPNPGRDVLRGFDVTTGALRWTYDTLPDGFGVVGVKGSGDRLAVACKPSSPTNLAAGLYLLILSVTTGDLLNSRQYPTVVATDATTTAWVDTALAQYRDGIVQLDLTRVLQPTGFAEGSTYDWYMSVAYRDTDLEQSVWEIQRPTRQDVPPEMLDAHLWNTSEPIVGRDLVAAASWELVSLANGAPSGLLLRDDAGFHTYVTRGGLVIDAVKAQGHDWVTAVQAWADLPASGLRWSYPFTAGLTDGGLYVMGCAPQEAIVLSTASALIGLAREDGHRLWQVGNPVSGYPVCATVTRGDQEVMAVAAGSNLALVDTASGAVVGAQPVKGPSGLLADWLVAIEPCGSDLVCGIGSTSDGSTSYITAVDYQGGAASTIWSEEVHLEFEAFQGGGAAQLYLTEAGLVMTTHPTPDTYAWLII